jgi:cytochrome b561
MEDKMTAGIGGYGRARRLMHWITAVLILPMIVVGLAMVQPGWPRAVQNTLFIAHKNIGSLLLLLVLLRVIIARRNPGDPLPQSLAGWQQSAAHASHGLLYLLLMVMPLSGYIRVRAGGFPIELLDRLGLPPLVPRSDSLAETAKVIHEYGGYALIAVLLAHIGAALHHALILRDGIWARIWPPFPR